MQSIAQIKEVCVLGGSGFVGSSIVTRFQCCRLSSEGVSASMESAKHLLLLPNVRVIECNVLDYKALNRELRGADAVINLLGILHQSRRNTFNLIHQQLPAQVS